MAGEPGPSATADFERVFALAPHPYLLIAADAPRFTVLAANAAYLKATRTTAEIVVGQPLFDLFSEDRRNPGSDGPGLLRASLERVMATAAPDRMGLQRYDVVRSRRDGGGFEERYWNPVNTPLTDADGRIAAILHSADDYTEIRRAEEHRSAREETLELAMEAGEIGAWDLDIASNELIWDARTRVMFGAAPDTPVTMEDFVAAIHPDDQRAVNRAFAAALDPEKRALYDVEYRTVGREDRAPRWIAAKGRVIFNADGAAVRATGTTIDITRRKRNEAQLRLMVNELNHRVKNTLATVQSITAQTLRGSELGEAVNGALLSRLIALSDAHDVLTDEQWAGADLWEIAALAAKPFQASDFERFALNGPALRLPPKMAIAFALALHELATNAAKYGALSVAGGRVELDWRVDEQAEAMALTMTWRERGGPPVTPPTRTGFGTRLIERALAAELQGRVTLSYPPDGVVCEIEARLARGPASGEWALGAEAG